MSGDPPIEIPGSSEINQMLDENRRLKQEVNQLRLQIAKIPDFYDEIDRLTKLVEKDGCDLCGDFPAEIRGKCHPTAPLRIELTADGHLEIYCYLPECNRHIATLKLSEG